MIEIREGRGCDGPWGPHAKLKLDHLGKEDGTRHHVTTRQVFGVRGITLHKAFAVFIEQITTKVAAAMARGARTRN
jgi:succinate dehydrogenase/fumarate reductase flavoprotein subunit